MLSAPGMFPIIRQRRRNVDLENSETALLARGCKVGTGVGPVAMVTLIGYPEGRVDKGLFALLVPQMTSSPGFCCRERAPG